VLVAVVPPLVAGADAATWLYRSLVLLVISCPCALVISTPVSIVSALSAAARNGVLIKGGAHLERLATVRTVAFDKTGTLTRGAPAVTEVITVGSASRADVLRFAAAVETRSEHPIARAIADSARMTGVAVPEAAGFMSIPGMGVEAFVGARSVLVGNAALMAQRSVATQEDLESIHRDGHTMVFVAVDRVVLGAIAVADPIRDAAREAVELLRSHGIRHVAMLTGDHAGSARVVAETLGVDEYLAGLLPQEKHNRVVAMRAARGAILMVGDGVNDAPALAAADVGVAMGAAGSDAALETADIALMSDELLKIPYALRLARATLFNVKSNVVVSLVLKAAFLILAITGSATLWMAVLADTGASVIVVANALRLLRQR
jgi:Zn2+/Cd2+-exporting ATPase